MLVSFFRYYILWPAAHHMMSQSFSIITCADFSF